jgi:hypothetical protein
MLIISSKKRRSTRWIMVLILLMCGLGGFGALLTAVIDDGGRPPTS